MPGGGRGLVEDRVTQTEVRNLQSPESASMVNSRSLWLAFWVCGFISLVLDQATKWIALGTLDPYAPPTVIPGLFELRLVHNDGAAFSMFRGGRWVFILVSLGAAFFLPLYLKSLMNDGEDHTFYPIGLGLIWGGAMGNAVDRVFREDGLVVDFFHCYWKQYSFPVFNVADSAITVGLIAIILAAMFLGTPKNPRGETDNVPDTL